MCRTAAKSLYLLALKQKRCKVRVLTLYNDLYVQISFCLLERRLLASVLLPLGRSALHFCGACVKLCLKR